jgi:alpha-tubulin suppressor-like RCC1 family protein
VKCWGENVRGQLGIGNTDNRGDTTNEMGDNLPAVSLGTGRTATAVAAGTDHACARLDNGTVKCWGYNNTGQLGLGNVLSKGDEAGEMGDSLPTVSLGTGRTAVAIGAGGDRTCAILDNGSLKCWGGNQGGALGLGDLAPRGDGPNEMGDNLPAVSLGTGRTAVAVSPSRQLFTCALLDNGAAKCWGAGNAGVLGQGDTADRGDGPNEMGDNLAAIALGAGRTATSISTGPVHVCVRLDNAAVKCWGSSDGGAVGLGDTAIRGDGPNEMGDNLPTVNLGPDRTAQAVTTGTGVSCARLDDNTVKCWGDNVAGQLGQGDTADRGDGPNEMGQYLPIVPLAPPGITGTVKDAVSTANVTTVYVAILRTSDFGIAATTSTTASGTFGVVVPPGSYYLYLIDVTGAHNPGFWGAPATITVVSTGVTAVATTVPPARGAISGTITDDPAGTPIAGAWAMAINVSGGIVGGTTTAANGTYTLTDLPVGGYHISFVIPGRPQEYYPNSLTYAGGQSVVVTAATTTPNINGALAFG